MSNPFKKIQAQSFTLAGAGSSIADQTIVLSSFNTIDGSPITMSMLGTKCFFTIEPGNGAQEEAGTFSGVIQNLNGTATLTGVKHQMFEDPYTETAGLTKSHAGGTTLILSNSAGFYGNFVDNLSPESIPTYTPTTPYNLTTKTWVENRNGYWEGAVANYAALAAITTDADGAARVTLDDSKLYVWDADSATWNLAGAGGGAGTVYITTKLGTEAVGDDNKTFQLDSGSFPDKKYLQVYKNGVLQVEGAGNDYIANGSNQAVFEDLVADDDVITLLVVSVDLYNPVWGSVNADILPDADNAYDIGSSSKKFKDGYFAGTMTANSFIGDGTTLSDGSNYLISGTTANKLVRLDTDAKLPAVDGSNLTNLKNSNSTFVLYPSSNVVSSADNVGVSTVQSMTKVKEIEFKDITGYINVSFQIWTTNSGREVSGLIYKNGAQYGTGRTTSNSSPQTYTETLQFTTNDLIQLYVNTGPYSSVQYSNFRLMYDKNIIPATNTINLN